ncbi:MAG: hypothetical protein ACNA8K_09175 [Cyclonatronaceae bacterium]
MLLATALTLAMLTGCTDNQPLDAEAGLFTEDVIANHGGAMAASRGMAGHFEETDPELVRAVKAATARFNSMTQAARAGYMDPGPGHCVAVPGLGAMGYHWVNMDLVDPVFNPLEPEALLYAYDKNGNKKLVGIEYIVIDEGQDHPHFGDHPFDVGGTPIPDDHYSLHVWLYESNPNGMFAPFNPNVFCPPAEDHGE